MVRQYDVADPLAIFCATRRLDSSISLGRDCYMPALFPQAVAHGVVLPPGKHNTPYTRCRPAFSLCQRFHQGRFATPTGTMYEHQFSSSSHPIVVDDSVPTLCQQRDFFVASHYWMQRFKAILQTTTMVCPFGCLCNSGLPFQLEARAHQGNLGTDAATPMAPTHHR